MKNKKPIAILGGMGPDASIKLYQLLIEKSREFYHAKLNEDYPEILIDSIPVPFFILDINKKENAKQMLIDRIKQLSKLPVGNFCIACNTVHVLLPDLQKETNIPFVSIIDEVVKTIKHNKLDKVGLMGSSITIKSNLYQKELNKSNIKIVLPSKTEIMILERIITEIVAGNYKNTKTIISISNNLKRNGAQGIILGCTELPLIFPKKYSLPVFDSLEILANELLKKYYEK